ncbi:uncharacterized protein PV09_02489 [Verruconis gallopava]|uniref:Vesicle-mediated transport protein Vid24 n=1 Tax=Verruconis gallopava TaxID=253628 RepID=A0A0D2B6E6_9PEZI|nr:uncharacterized protein PV09_02489 [Verruconis gallopava]KIW06809.1 hypothetical protein PV09_02489 [Verruconis gallopava]
MPTQRPETVPVDLRHRCLEENSHSFFSANGVRRQVTPPEDDECDKTPTPRPAEPSVDGPARDIPTPVSTSDDTTSETEQRLSQSISSSSASLHLNEGNLTGTLSSPWPKTRFVPNSSSSNLQPGSVFRGTQQSDRQVYEVEVQLQHVDMAESFLCGYLKIQGLTDDHPTLTTYFEGEIIGSKYTFQTKHPEWGSTDKVDMQHWGRFPAWRPLAKQAKTQQDFTTKNFAQRENIFMRWKEHFLVPDHRVRTISGASFEGFYYICFNQVTGCISGIYFHAKSEKYQQLELKHVEDHGCTPAFEFR